MKIWQRYAWILASIIALGRLTPGQEVTASLRGTVVDASGGVVTKATVTAAQEETGLKRSRVTDAQGSYVLVELPVGHYRVEVERQGFKKYVQEGISLSVNQTATVMVHLAIGLPTQEVQVSTDAPLVEPEATSLGQTVGEREVLDLPLNGRHFTQLGLLQPGVAPVTPGLLEAGGTLREGQAYAVNGQRPESNNFLIDGADNFNAVDGGFVLEPPVDAISEFRILTHTANAEFGHSTGSTTNIVTRSGTNSFHGAAWEFFRNNAMDAKSFFADSVEPLHRNQFGGTFGGPIRRDKTFFFGYYEGLRNSQGETTRTTVPSDAERQGNFGHLCTDTTAQGQTKPDFFDTSGNCLLGDGSGPDPNGQLMNFFVPPNSPPVIYPFNQLPSINSISQNLLAFYPHANSGAYGLVATQILTSNLDQFGVRVDHYLTQADVLNFRYSFAQRSQTDPLSTAGANVPGFPVGENQRSQNFVDQETHTFSPTVVGQFRFSYLRNKFL